MILSEFRPWARSVSHEVYGTATIELRAGSAKIQSERAAALFEIFKPHKFSRQPSWKIMLIFHSDKSFKVKNCLLNVRTF